MGATVAQSYDRRWHAGRCKFAGSGNPHQKPETAFTNAHYSGRQVEEIIRFLETRYVGMYPRMNWSPRPSPLSWKGWIHIPIIFHRIRW